MAADQKRGKDLPERIQMRCPKCGEEFAFSRGNLEKERAELVLKCDEAKLHLREINKLPKSAHTDQTWRDKTYWSRIYEQVTQRLTEIKVQFRQVNQTINDSLFHLYRERMIDIYGKDADEFHFTLDPCSTDENAKCEKHYTKEQDGLKQDWTGETVFCNPPYGKEIWKWCRKCYEHSLNGGTAVMLVHARTDTGWFHDFVYGKAELRFIRGRLHFNGSKWNAPFPSIVAIYKGVEKV